MFHLISQFSLLILVAGSPAFISKGDVETVGGEEIEINEAPYQVAVLLSDHPHCDGAIIDVDIIVTTARCLAVTGTPSDFTIRAGSKFIQRGGQIYQVRDFVGHPGWSYETEDYDVGIIWLSSSLAFSEVVKPIKLANMDDEILDGEGTALTGWGYTDADGNDLPMLQRVRMEKVNDVECKQAYAPVTKITSRMMCARLREETKDVCQGDSGGPLVYNQTLCGIVSWGYGCAKSGLPGVFAKVSALRGWIDENIILLKKTALKKD